MITETANIIKVFYNFIIVVVSAVLAYLGIEKEPLLLLSLLLVIDYITGLYKANALGQSITSNKMKYGCISKMLLLLIPIVLAIAAKGVGADFTFALIAGLNILIISETYSIIGNIYASTKRKELPEIDAIAMIGKSIRNYLLKLSGEDNVQRKKDIGDKND